MSQNACTSCGAVIEGKVSHVQNEELIKKLNDLKRKTPIVVKSGDIVCRSCIVVTSRYDDKKKKKNDKQAGVSEVKTLAELKAVEVPSNPTPAPVKTEPSEKVKLVDAIVEVIRDLEKKDQSTQVTVKRAERKEKSTQTQYSLDLNSNCNHCKSDEQNANDLGLLILEHASRMHSEETFSTQNFVNLHQATQTKVVEVTEEYIAEEHVVEEHVVEQQIVTKSVLNDLQGCNKEDSLFGCINDRMKHSLSFTEGIENRQKKRQF